MPRLTAAVDSANLTRRAGWPFVMRRTILRLLVALTLGQVACKSRTGSRADATAAKATTLAELAAEVGIAFPPSSRLLGVSRENGMDDLVMFKVELPRRDLASFLAKCPVPADAFEEGSAGFLGPDDGFWDPGKARHLRTGQSVRNTRATRMSPSTMAGLMSLSFTSSTTELDPVV